jgi:anti-sigma regulatory factor (Ser/Thr protein kinase)
MPDELDLELPRLQTAVSVARSAVSDRFAEQLGRDRVDELLLVGSELVTNPVLHGRGAITLKLSR